MIERFFKATNSDSFKGSRGVSTSFRSGRIWADQTRRICQSYLFCSARRSHTHERMSGAGKRKKKEAAGVRPRILRSQAAAFTTGFACAFLILILDYGGAGTQESPAIESASTAAPIIGIRTALATLGRNGIALGRFGRLRSSFLCRFLSWRLLGRFLNRFSLCRPTFFLCIGNPLTGFGAQRFAS